MTIRDHLKSQLNKVRAVAIGSWLLMAATILPAEQRDQLSPLMLFPMVLFFGSVVYMIFGIKCPRCKTGVGQHFTWHRMPNFCSHCGVSFDEELQGAEKSSQPTSEKDRDATSGTDRFV